MLFASLLRIAYKNRYMTQPLLRDGNMLISNDYKTAMQGKSNYNEID